jgi:hypothetical protein
LSQWDQEDCYWAAAAADLENPCKFWCYLRDALKPLAERKILLCKETAIVQLADLAVKLFSVLPNAVDPEGLFSKLGRLINPSSVQLGDKQSRRMVVFSNDYKLRSARLDNNPMAKTTARFSEKAAVALRLIEIGSQSAIALCSVPVGGVATMSTTLSGIQGNDISDEGHDDDADDDDADDDEVDDIDAIVSLLPCTAGGREGGSEFLESACDGLYQPLMADEEPTEGVDVLERSQEFTDERITSIAVDCFDTFRQELSRAVAISDESAMVGTADREDVMLGDDIADGDGGVGLSENRRESGLSMYTLGNFPIGTTKTSLKSTYDMIEPFEERRFP